MSWVNSFEILVGSALVAIGALIMWVFKDRKAEPSSLMISLFPVAVLLIFVAGIATVLHGLGKL